MTWLLTGGAGYIGGHVSRALAAAGQPVIVLDDLSTGSVDRVPATVPLVRGSVHDVDLVRATLRDHRITGVVHLAAKKSVSDSVQNPLLYYRENVEGFRSVLDAMDREGVRRMVLSSSAAVYGMPDIDAVDEQTSTEPVNPYGETKLVCERMLRNLGRAQGMSWIVLRYFNVAGAQAPELADDGDSNLIPMVFRALEDGDAPRIFGGDYPTADGSCVRDFIHVADLADAHVAAVNRLNVSPTTEVYNVGRGEGYSVREVLLAVQHVTGSSTAPEVVQRRLGDPARVVGDTDKINTELGWRARRDLDDMVRDAWSFRSAHEAAVAV